MARHAWIERQIAPEELSSVRNSLGSKHLRMPSGPRLY